MKAVEFVYWLQGFYELNNPRTLNARQTEMVKKHLALVFKHEIDPSYSEDEKVQQTLQKIHDGITLPKPIGPHLGDDRLIRC